MVKLRFHLVLLAFILIFDQKYAQGIKCLQCDNCSNLGIAENNTCVIDGGFCLSAFVREKGIGKDVIQVTRRCMSKDQSILCTKHKQNVKCCRDHDLCNIETPELVSGVSITKVVIIIATFIIILTIIACILIYVKKQSGPPDQNINTNPLMGSEPSSPKELNNCSQSGNGSGIIEEHQLPYRNLVLRDGDLSLEDMRKVFCGDKQRPSRSMRLQHL